MTEEFEASLYVGPFLEEAKERLEDFVKALLILEKRRTTRRPFTGCSGRHTR